MEEENNQGKIEIIDKVFRDDPNDERPLGGGNKFSIPEFADGEAPPGFVPPPPKRKVVNTNKLAPKNKPIIESSVSENKENNEQEISKSDSTPKQNNAEQIEDKADEGFVKIDRPIRNDPSDDRPLGGGTKFQISEYPDGDAPPPEVQPKQRVIPKKFGSAKTDNQQTEEQDSQLETSSQPQENQSASSTSDDKPWLKKKGTTVSQPKKEEIEQNNNDEQPIGGKGSYNIEDERPLGGGNKTAFNPDEERPIGSKKQAMDFDDEQPVGGAKKNNFIDEDDRPVGVGQKSAMLSEYPEGMDPDSIPDSTASKDDGPLSKRILHKVVKNRMNAFQELAQELEQRKKDLSFFNEFESDWDKKIVDMNPGVQEQACIALKNWITFHPNYKNLKLSDCVSILKALIEKCIGGGKPQVLVVSKELLCLLYEKCSDQNDFFEALNVCVKNKNAKVGCAAIQCITDLLINYGPKKFDYMKPFFAEIEKQSLSTNSSIRTECMNFFKEAMKWLGDTIIKNYTKNLKKLQQDELDKFYSEWDKQPMIPLRASEEEKKAATSKGASSGASGGGEVDIYEIADAIDIFVKYNDRWCDKVLALSKWQEKKEHLDEIITAASQPKVAGNNYMPVVGMIKRLLNDNNSNVQLNSIKLTGCLSKSIRKGFNLGSKQLFDQIIIKFRDKKTLINEETKATIDNFWYSITLEEVIEEIKESLQDKAPPMKMQVMQAVERYFDARPNASKSREAFKTACIPTIKKLFDDSNQEVREYCLKLIGKFNREKGWFTNEEINNLTSSLNEQKKQKIQQGAENNGESNMAASKIVPKSGGASTQPTKAKPQEDEEEVKESKPLSSTVRVGLKKPAEKPSGNGGGSSAAANNNGGFNDEEVSSSSIPTTDECEEKLKDNGMPEEYTKVFAGAKNPEKVEALQSMMGSAYFTKCLLETLVYLDKVAFKSSILVVQKEVLNLVESAADNDNFNKKCFHVITEFLVKYVGEVKFNAQVQSVIEKSCERLMPKYVLSRMIRVLKQDEKKMSPKSAQELSKTIAHIIDIAQIKYVNFMDVLQFAKDSISNTNVSIKAGGQEILKKLYEHTGENLTNFLKDIPPNVMATLQKEFSKLAVLSESDKISLSTMKFIGDAGKEIAQAATSSKGSASSNPFDQLPRADISKDAEKVFKKLTDPQWKTRKEGLDELDKLMQKSNNRIQINGLFDLLALLKQSLQESNKGLQRQAFNFVGRFAEACGKDLRPHSKTLLCQIVSNLSNKETLMRKEVIQALDRFEKAIGGEAIINVMATYLSENNPEQRTGIIEWILRYPEAYQASDLTAFVTPILNCLEDKTKEIRVLAEQLLEKTIQIITAQPFKYAFKDMKPATVKTIQPILAKYTNLDDDGDIPTPVQRNNNKSATQVLQAGGKAGEKPKILLAGANTKAGAQAETKTLTRNATTINLKVNDQNSDTASNNGDKTPQKSKYGLNHSHSTNKLQPKTDVSNNIPKTSYGSNQGSSQNIQSQAEDQSGHTDKIQMQQSQIHELQMQLEATKQSNPITSAVSNRLSSLVDQTAKISFIDDSRIFPLSNSISALKQKRSNFPLYQSFNIQNPSNEHFEFIQNELKFLLSSSVTPLMFSFNYRSLIQATDCKKYFILLSIH